MARCFFKSFSVTKKLIMIKTKKEATYQIPHTSVTVHNCFRFNRLRFDLNLCQILCIIVYFKPSVNTPKSEKKLFSASTNFVIESPKNQSNS